MSFLETLDFFSTPPMLFVKNYEGYKSKSGGLVTIFAVASCFALIFIEIDNYLNTSSPTELDILEKFREHNATLNKSNLFFAFVIDRPSAVIDDKLHEKVFFPGGILHHGDRSPFTYPYNDEGNMFFEDCNKYDLNLFSTTEEVRNTIYKKGYCLNLNNSIMSIVEGNSESFLEIAIFKNDSEMSNIIGLGMGDGLYLKFNLTIYYQSLLNSPSKFSAEAITKELNAFKIESSQSNIQYFDSSLSTVTSIKKSDYLSKGDFAGNRTYYDTEIIKLSDGAWMRNAYNVPGASLLANADYTRIVSLSFSLLNSNSVRILQYPNFFDVFSQIGGTLSLILTVLQAIFIQIQKFEQMIYLDSQLFSNDSLINEKDPAILHNAKRIRNKKIEKDNAIFLTKNTINNKSLSYNAMNQENNQNKSENFSILNKDISKINNLTKEKIKIEKSVEKATNKPPTRDVKAKERNKISELLTYIMNKDGSYYMKYPRYFLSIENIVRWNTEWIAYKSLILTKRQQTIMKYIDIDKIYMLDEEISSKDKKVVLLERIWQYLRNSKGNLEDEDKIYSEKFQNLIVEYKKYDFQFLDMINGV